MADQTERHNVNLSRQVWGELKLRSFQEGVSASELLSYVVERFTSEGYHAFSLPRYQPRADDADRLGRTVFLPAEVWQRVQSRAAQYKTSTSGLIDYALRRYLGLLPEDSTDVEPPPRNTVKIGEERVYLGENPLRIDLKTGQPKQD